MSTREGNLEAPTRHPIPWRSAEYYDEAACSQELERIFGICHGCRRCVSLCNAFPTLFDLVDATDSGEIDGVAHQDFRKVVDQCYLCDLCYMTKCPYVPPHPWNLDFPHTMLRAKAIKFKQGEVRLRDRLLSSTDAVGRLATIPVVVRAVNAANKSAPVRAAMDSALGIKKERWLPEYDSARFRDSVTPSKPHPVRDGERTRGKVAIFSTCYVNYNEPGIGHDLVAILDHNEIPHLVVDKEACCGMPKLELGDLEAVARNKEKNIPVLAKLAREGYAILTPVPSCTLMFKSELPLLFSEDADVAAVSAAMMDPFEYLVLRGKDGLLKTDFKQPLGTISYHVPCHSRVQNIGRKTEEVLKMTGATVNTVERCSGHDGTWGVKSEYYEMSMKIGRPVFKMMSQGEPDYVSSDCAIAARHILQGMTEAGSAGSVQKRHPLTLVRMAYGL
ncbi:MAG TPA: heterodisulfide reductase-related iron-sulfur binding cluster [Rhodocyclaceae bacterium]|nr:heterodisulfide reductase-related iron-sulfur binding cluster [Rhodocyclaceae bacterium]